MRWNKLYKKDKNGKLRFFNILEQDKELEMYAYEHTLKIMPDLEALVLLKHILIYPNDPYIEDGDHLKYFKKMFDDFHDKHLLEKLLEVLNNGKLLDQTSNL